jgi:hypothetical protein
MGRQRIHHVRKDMAHVALRIGIAAFAAAGALIAKGKVPDVDAGTAFAVADVPNPQGDRHG